MDESDGGMHHRVEKCEDDNATCNGQSVTKKLSKTTTYIDIDMIPTKITYLLWGGLVCTYQVYIMPFFVSMGLSVSQAGIIIGMISVSSSVANPLWGMVTDYTGHRKTILFLLCSISAMTIFSLPWVALTLRNDMRNNSCDVSYNKTSDKTANTINLKECLDIEKDTISALLQVYFILITLGSIFFATLPCYIDAIASTVVKTSPSKASYGAQRIFGSIGCCIAFYMTGFAVDECHIVGMPNYSIAIIAYVPFPLLMIPLGCYLIQQTSSQKKQIISRPIRNTDIICKNMDTGIFKSLLLVVRQIDVLFFLFTVFISGLALSLFINFTSVFVDEEMNLPKAKVGSLFTIGSASSIVMFPYTAKLIKLHGPLPAISIGISSYCIRYLFMSYVRMYWVIAAIQTLQSVGFALTWASIMEHIHAISPKKIEVTMILLVQSVHFGVAPFVMNLIGGKVYEQYGGKILFCSVAVLCGMWSLLLYIQFYVRYCLRKGRSRDKISDVSEVEMF